MKRLFLVLFLMTAVIVTPNYSYAQRGAKLVKQLSKLSKTNKMGKVVKPKVNTVVARGVAGSATKSQSAIISRVATIGGIRIANQLQPNGNVVEKDGKRMLLKPCFSCNRHGYIYSQGFYYLCNSCKGYGFIGYHYTGN